MPFYSGQHGQLFITVDGGSEVKAAKVKSFGFSSSQAVLDTTSLEDTDRTLIAGMRSLSGTARLAYHKDAANSDTSNMTSLINSFLKPGSAAGDGANADSTAVTFRLRIADTNNQEIVFSAFITSFNINVAIGEVIEADVSFEANGAPTTIDL